MSARLIKNKDGDERTTFVAFNIPQANPSARRHNGEATPFLPPERSLSQSAPAATAHATPAQGTLAVGAEAEGSAALAPAFDIEEARAEGERIVTEAEIRAAEIEHAARTRGLAEGRAAAETEIARAVEALRAQLSQSIVEVADLRAEVSAQAEHELVRLAVEIAKKIIHREVTVDSEIALTLARVALARVHRSAVATIRLHPDDYAYVKTHCERLEGHCSIELVEDRAVSRGGCFVQTEMGDIDARIEQQFAEIERSFFGR